MSDEEAVKVRDQVRNPQADRAGTPDEEAVLRSLYGAPDENGVYKGEEVSR